MDKQDGQSQQPSLHQPSDTAHLPEPDLAEPPQEKQLTSQQRSAQSQAIPAQPTATSSSHLNGIAGWLAFFMVVLIVGALLFLGVFFNTLIKVNKPRFLPSDLPFPFAESVLPIRDSRLPYMVSAIMAPVVAVLAIAAVVAISRRKRLGGQLAIATLVASFLHTILMTVTYTLINGLEMDVVMGFICIAIMQAIAAFLCCLYFRISRRVKETLVG